MRLGLGAGAGGPSFWGNQSAKLGKLKTDYVIFILLNKT